MTTHPHEAAIPQTRLTLAVIPDVYLKPLAVLLFVLLVAIAAQIRIPLPGGVPITLQTLFVSLAALTLGPRLGTLAMVLYVALGIVGVPVFSDFGHGPQVILGATGGYIVGFILAQPVINLVMRWGRTPPGAMGSTLAVVAGHLVIFALGVPWLAVSTGHSAESALANGFLPFVPGLVLKSLVAGLPGARLASWSRRRGW